MTTPTVPPVSNSFKAIVRSVVPYIEGAVAAAVAKLGWHVTIQTAAEVTLAAGTGLSILLHAAEAKWPWVGAFLGYVGAPVYAPSTKKTLAAQVAQLEAQIATLTAQQAEKSSPSSPTVPTS